MTRIAVILRHYRQSGFLAACLESLLAQTRVPDEIIVVDSSPEDTGAIISSYGKRVRRLRQPAAGVAAARNAGLNATTCDLVAFLDADNIAATDRIEWQIDVFASSPDIVLSHGALVPIGRRRTGYAGMSRITSEQVPTDQQLGWLIARNRIATDTVCARRDIVTAAGGFCEAPGVRGDYDLWLRMATRGRFHFIDAPLAVDRCLDAHLGNDDAYMFEREAGALRRLDWPVIADALRRAFPDAAERSIVEGEVRLRRGEFAVGELHFIALARQPRAAGALFHLAHLAMSRGSLDFAEALLRRALKEEPGDAGLWNNLGVVLARTNRHVEGAKAFAQAIRMHPLDVSSAHNLQLLRSSQIARTWSAWRVARSRPRPHVTPLAAAA